MTDRPQISGSAISAQQARDIGLSAFEGTPRIEHRVFDEHRPVIEPDQVGDAQGLIVLTPKVTRATVSRSDDLLAIGRFGVGGALSVATGGPRSG